MGLFYRPVHGLVLKRPVLWACSVGMFDGHDLLACSIGLFSGLVL